MENSKTIVRSRTFTFSLILTNQTNRKDYSDDEKIKSLNVTLEKYSSIQKWAYIVHDECKYTARDVEEYNDRLKKAYENNPEGYISLEEYKKHKTQIAINAKKKIHVHVLIYCSDNLPLEYVARWFDISTSMIKMPKGRNQFRNELFYLTHGNDIEKHQYDVNLIHSNFEHKKEIEELRSKLFLSKGDNKSKQLSCWIEKILKGEYTLKDCENENPILFGNNIGKLKANRINYLNTSAPPASRMNIYISGVRKDGSAGGTGKSVAAKSLAREIAKSWAKYENASDSEIFFHVGAGNVSFEGYDGQPIIIWDDFKAQALLHAAKNRDNLFRIFDTHPEHINQNIKNSYINLINKVNIICSCQSSKDFLNVLKDNIGSDSQDKIELVQITRRFPLMIELNEDHYKLSQNISFFSREEDTVDYTEKSICGSFSKVMKTRASIEAKNKVLSELCKPIANIVINWMNEEETELSESNFEVEEMLKTYGREFIPASENPTEGFIDADEETMKMFQYVCK